MSDAIVLTVNGKRCEVVVEATELLIDVIRERLQLWGSRVGCLNGDCGACTMRVDGKVVKSCLILAAEADGARIDTIEEDTRPSMKALQASFQENYGFQCGFCTSGMLTVAADLLERNADPSEAEVRTAIAGNLCRCTGYDPIIKSIREAARALRGEDAVGKV